MRDPTIPLAALNAEQAIRYLRKEDPGLDGDARGWLLAAYEGHALGWLKGLGNRYNNYFPKEWRILSHQFRSRD
jgi:NOL1/NOP2/fmu family ribosome biogenesis protein